MTDETIRVGQTGGVGKKYHIIVRKGESWDPGPGPRCGQDRKRVPEDEISEVSLRQARELEKRDMLCTRCIQYADPFGEPADQSES